MAVCPSVMFENVDTKTAENMRIGLIRELSRGRAWDWVQPNMFHDHIFPIGVTWSHAFVMTHVMKQRAYQIHAIDISNGPIDTPFDAAVDRRQFLNPWKTWPNTMANIVTASCYLSMVCLVLPDRVVVLDAAKNWKVVVSIAGKNFSNITHCSINHRFLAVCQYEKKTTKLSVYEFSSEKFSHLTINNAEATALYLPEEMSQGVRDDIYVCFTKHDGSGQKPTCVFSFGADGKLKVQKKLFAWPSNVNLTNGTDSVRYRLGNFVQTAENQLVCYFASNQNMCQTTRQKIIHVQTLGDVGFVLFQGDNSMIIHDFQARLNITIEPNETVQFASIATFKKHNGVPDYRRCYDSFKVFTDRIVLLLPNGTLGILRSCSRTYDNDVSDTTCQVEDDDIDESGFAASSSSSTC